VPGGAALTIPTEQKSELQPSNHEGPDFRGRGRRRALTNIWFWTNAMMSRNVGTGASQRRNIVAETVFRHV